MKQFILNIGWILLLSIATTSAVELFIFWQMDNRRAHLLEDWPDMKGLDVDIVFLGNSRIAGHVVPDIACHDVGKSCYNLAYHGYTSQMGAHRLDYLLDNAARKPKSVAVQLDLSFCAREGVQKNFPMKDGVLRYFFWDNIGINKYFRDYENWRELDAYIPLLRYKGYPLVFVKHVLGWNRWDRRAGKGFWHTDKRVGFELENAPLDSNMPVSLCGIDSICSKQNIELIGIIPPSPRSCFRPAEHILDSLSQSIVILDYSNLFAGQESAYFYDQAHFSSAGAEYFSQKLNADLLHLQTTSSLKSNLN